MVVYINSIKFNRSLVDGPGVRTVVFFQGCDLRCKGCQNPSTWEMKNGTEMTTDELVTILEKEVVNKKVTFSGGEPSLQQNLPILTSKIQELGLGVISFTGRIYEEVKECFVGCDVVIDGAYKQDEQDTQRRIIGSKNQRVICLTERYKDCIDVWFNSSETRIMEVGLTDKIIINGDPF